MVEAGVSGVGAKDATRVRKSPFVVACIPAFNEERSIAKVVVGAQRFVDCVIVCDDGSSDMTGKIAAKLGADVIRHEKNLGYGVTLQSLFKRAREWGADIMVTLDGDGQHDTGEIPSMVEPVVEGKADVVVGSRFLANGVKSHEMPRYRRIGVKVITGLTGAASSYGLSDAQSGFRAYGRKALEVLSLGEEGMGASVEVLIKARTHGLSIVEVPVGCTYRGLGKTSNHNAISHGTSVVMSIMRLVVEERPLIFLGLPGVFSMLIGAFFGIWLLQIYAVRHQIETNIALASMVFILIGFFAVFTAITLYAISRSVQKTRNHEARGLE